MSWKETYEDKGSSQNLRIEALMREKEIRDEAELRPLEFLCEDITQDKLKISFIAGLNHNTYNEASEEARTCLIISLKCRSLNPRLLVSWIQKLNHCFNNIIIELIEEVFQERIIIKHPTKGSSLSMDRRAFTHLEFANDKEDFVRNIGIYFNSMYEDLNRTKHLLEQKDDGRVKVSKRNYSYLKNENIDRAKKAVNAVQRSLEKYIDACHL